MKIFSKGSQYAIRAMMCVLETDSLSSFSTKDVCQNAGIPEAFARKAFQEMAKVGIIKGVPGPKGGYLFVRAPSEISLLEIVFAVDGRSAFAECPMGLRCQAALPDDAAWSCEDCTLKSPKCGLSHLCPLHDLWKEARQVAIRHLQETTLQDIKDRLDGSPSMKPLPEPLT